VIHNPISSDPDVAQAVEDFAPTVAEIQRREKALLRLDPTDQQRAAEARFIQTMHDDVALRAERIGMTGPGLVQLITAQLSTVARRGRAAPERETSRTLLDAYTNALAAETEAQRAVNAARLKLTDAQAARRAAEEAYRTYSAGPVVL
jgi:hypothetical protein